jgi:hypothetical protein
MSQETPIKKKIDKKVTALTLICVILASSLVGVIAIYQLNPNSDLQAQINQKDDLINLQQTQITSLLTQIATLKSQLSQATNVANSSDYSTEIASLQQSLSDANTQVSTLYNILILNQSSSLISQQAISQNGNSTSTVWNDQILYAGYLFVQADATSNTTYAEVLYSFAGVNFDFNQTLGTTGTATFPVLPGAVEVRIGNTMQGVVNNATVTVTYYF